MRKWLEEHYACKEGYEWAMQNCSTMQEVWDTAKPEWLAWVAVQVLTDKELHEFSLFCAESVRHLMTNPCSTNALDVKRRWLDGQATDEELDIARSDAWSAEGSVAWSTAWSAAWSAARPAARPAAQSAARLAAQSAAWSAAESDQAQWLRNNTTPRFI